MKTGTRAGTTLRVPLRRLAPQARRVRQCITDALPAPIGSPSRGISATRQLDQPEGPAGRSVQKTRGATGPKEPGGFRPSHEPANLADPSLARIREP